MSNQADSDSPKPLSWLRSVRHVSLLTLVSRILGLVRDMGMAALFGNGPLLDAFTLAFRIPNLMRRLFGEGALTTAFLPAYISARKQGPEQAARLASGVLIILFSLLTGLILLGWCLLALLQASGWLGADGEHLIWMTAWLLPYVLLICLTAQYCALLHAENRFVIPALVPVLMNLVWIVAIWQIAPAYASSTGQLKVIIISILVGGVVQLIVPVISLWKLGFRLQFPARADFSRSRSVFLVMLPIVWGLSITQINALCDGALAWWFSLEGNGNRVEQGAASALYFGQRMYQFPLGIFGAAMGTVLFARLAQHVEAKNWEDVIQDVSQGMRLTLLIGIPASFGMLVLAEPIARILLERGKFDHYDTIQTTRMIIAYSVAIWAYLGITVTQRVLFAIQDARTPVRLGMIAVIVNLLLSLPLMFWLGGKGLAIATSVASIMQFLLLVYALSKRLQRNLLQNLMSVFLKSSVATALMCIGIHFALKFGR
ncbi:MAG: murein biosynthesis integral membrane protein MurJ, partial [Planctomycetaceae bacterium]|nr:murein biosynthesis integral membrane protein MurJ [Planctomycetaceae bacterium]